MSPVSPAATADPPAAKKPRGNPTLALAARCGARTRAGCPCQAPAIHGKLRCRMHGGRSTGPRTPKGFADLRAARTIHGYDGAEARADDRWRLTTLRRIRVEIAARRYQAHLPPAVVARLYDYAPELMPPPRPTGGITAEMDRIRRRAVAAALAPWQRAIADARAAERADRAAARAAARLAKLHAPVGARPPRDAGVSGAHAPIPGAGPATAARAAARVAQAHAPVGARSPGGAYVPGAHAPIPGAAGRAAAARADCPAEATAAASPADARQGRRPTPARPAGQNPVAAHVAGARAPDRAPGPGDAGVAKLHAPIPGPAAPATPPGLPNRAARRRWKRQQRLLRRVPAAGARA